MASSSSPPPNVAPAPNGTDGEPGRLAHNIAVFGKVLRRAGLPVGHVRVLDAIRAVETAGIRRRDDLYWTLHAVFVSRADQRPVFDAAFGAFWRTRNLEDKMMELLSPVADERPAQDKAKAGAARVAEAMAPPPRDRPSDKPPELEIDARATSSDREILRTKDFAQMTATEVAEARRAIRAMTLPFDRAPVRRRVPSPRAREFDPRRSLRASLRTGGESIALRFRERARKPPPVVAIVDISGSMGTYSRLVLHFLHALGETRRVTTFLFGTRLTNVTRQLADKDPDEALAGCSEAVSDWSGGTRIGSTLKEFNFKWSRRVMSGNPIVLLVTDGLEREPGDDLVVEADRLHRSCRRLIWLNPLLRYDGFEPKARGIQAILPHVDEFRPIHSVDAVADLVAAISAPHPGRRLEPRSRAMGPVDGGPASAAAQPG